VYATDRRDHFVLRVADKTSDAVVDDLGNASLAKGNHRCAARHRFHHHQTERLGPADRKQQGRGIAQELIFRGASHFANEARMRWIQQRLDVLLVVAPVGAHVGVAVPQWLARGDPQRLAGSPRDLDRSIQAFLG